jgi:hypothetical protein
MLFITEVIQAQWGAGNTVNITSNTTVSTSVVCRTLNVAQGSGAVLTITDGATVEVTEHANIGNAWGGGIMTDGSAVTLKIGGNCNLGGNGNTPSTTNPIGIDLGTKGKLIINGNLVSGNLTSGWGGKISAETLEMTGCSSSIIINGTGSSWARIDVDTFRQKPIDPECAAKYSVTSPLGYGMSSSTNYFRFNVYDQNCNQTCLAANTVNGNWTTGFLTTCAFNSNTGCHINKPGDLSCATVTPFEITNFTPDLAAYCVGDKIEFIVEVDLPGTSYTYKL